MKFYFSTFSQRDFINKLHEESCRIHKNKMFKHILGKEEANDEGWDVEGFCRI